MTVADVDDSDAVTPVAATVPIPARGAPVLEPLPRGFRLDLDSSVRQLADDLLAGGVPKRVLRLTPAGARAWTELSQCTPVRSRSEGLLARRLVDAGLAHPVPPTGGPTLSDVTVVVPVLDRPRTLARCLTALGRSVRVVVVDDGSADPAAVAAVAAEHGARLVRRSTNGGPGAARNTGLLGLTSPFVAFLDSDCVPPTGWLEPLLTHLADPLVAAVAPRIVGDAPFATANRHTVADRHTVAGRYTVARGNLDLGPAAGRVTPTARVRYVPTAALVARTAALADVARHGYVFEPGLRYGEDVDLVWRLDAAGWRVRYQPESQVGHSEPDRWRVLLARRFRYGTSAAPLAAAHPDCVAPLVLLPWPALAVGALLARRPVPAAAALAVTAVRTRRRLRGAGLPTAGAAATAVQATYSTWLGGGRYLTQFAAPAVLAAAVLPGRPGRRVAAASLLLAGPLQAWWPRRRALDPVRFTAGYLADEIAYGAGVWASCLRRRTLTPVRPRIVRRSSALLSRTPVKPSSDEGVTP